MKGSSSDTRGKIDGWFDLHSEELLRDLERLVAVNSVRGAAEEGAPYGTESRRVLALAEQMLTERGFEVSNFEDIIVTADCGEAPCLGILAHLDIVEAGEGWDTDPFVLTERDGKLYGRGTSDDKGPAAAAMYAMYCARELYPELLQKSGVRLILGSGEETGCEDIARYIAKIPTPRYVFTPDSDFPVVNAEKGRFVPTFKAVWPENKTLPRVVSIAGGRTANIVPNRAEAVLEGFIAGELEELCREYSERTGAVISVKADGNLCVVSAEGVAAHASKPQEGVNAQTALLSMLAVLPCAGSRGFECVKSLNRIFPHGDHDGKALGISMRDDITGKLTVNFGVLHFNSEGFTANFDSRTPACADEADIEGITKKALSAEAIDVTYVSISRCHYTPEDSHFVQVLLRVYEEYSGQKSKCLAVGGSTYVHEIPGGVAFGCELPGIDNRIHGANEFIGKEQLFMSAKMFTQAILDLCE